MGAVDQTQTSFWQDHPDYHGTLCAVGDSRLAISPNGCRYLLQRRLPDGHYFVERWRKQLSKLRPDLPRGYGKVIKGLPDDPLKYPRPWAVLISQQSERLFSARLDADQYAGVIASSGEFRLVIAPDRSRYIVQRREPHKWQYVVSSVSALKISDRVSSSLPSRHKAFAVSRDPVFMAALLALPDRASDYREKAIETLAEACKLPRPRATARRAVRRSGGPLRGAGGVDC